METVGNQSSELVMLNEKCIEEYTIPRAGEAARSLCPSDSDNLLPLSVPVANSILVETKLDEISFYSKLGPKSPDIDDNVSSLLDSSILMSDVPPHEAHDNLLSFF